MTFNRQPTIGTAAGTEANNPSKQQYDETMCGFAGFLTYGNCTSPIHERQRTLAAMGHAIAHRGPDDVRYYDDGSLALVFRRLSIIDIGGGDQPFVNESRGLLGVVNGEIYNHAVLRRELAAKYRFKSRSDCEVPLHAYDEWGTDALSRLNGMFAIALWDWRKKELLLARDRLGIKPLYICHVDDGLLFASELKALLTHPQCPRQLDWDALCRTPIMQHPRTTYVKGVELIPGGEFLKVTSSRVIQRRPYWCLDGYLGSAPYGLDAEAYGNHYCELLEEVTLEHLQSDVKVGLHLSGGLDSSLLAAIISGRDKEVPCFTVVERTTYRAGDVRAAGEVTSELGLPWLPVLFDYRTIVDDLDFNLQTMEQNIRMMDSPRFDLEWLFKGELDRVARAHYPDLKVLILGQGGDEFAGGYSSRLTNMRSSWADYLRDEVEPNLHFDDTTRNAVPLQLWSLLSYRPTPCLGATGPYHKMMQLLLGQLQHHNLWHEDRSSSWHSLEARVPFLDHRIVELLASVPEALHEKLFWKKRIVRDAMRKFLPSYDLSRAKVGFFETDDGRSIELIMNTIVERIVPDFRAQYMENSDCIFARDKIDSLAHRVLARAPGHFQDAKQLLECIAISVFDRQLRTPDAAWWNDRRVEQAPLRVVQSAEWADIDASMSSEPIIGREWDLNRRVELPVGAEIVTSLTQGQNERYVLTALGRVCAQIEVPSGHPWLGAFLKSLATDTRDQRTIQDWIDEFQVAPASFLEHLSVLNRCGFVSQAGDGLTHGADTDGDQLSAVIATPM